MISTIFRYLRLKYHIHNSELAPCVGVSSQLFSVIDLGNIPATKHNETMVNDALCIWIKERRKMLDALEKDLQKYEGRLLEPAEEVDEYGI